MTNTATAANQDYYYVGQAVKTVGHPTTGIIVDVQEEHANMSVMGFGGGGFKQINYRMIVVWDGLKLQRNVNEHDILTLHEGHIAFDDATILMIDAEQKRLNDNKTAEEKRELERASFNTAVEIALELPEYSHLTPREPHKGGGVQVAKNIRKHLKKLFPAVKFSVKSDYSSVNVSWTNGPTEKEVSEKIDCFSNGTFDSYTDYHGTKDTPFNMAFGGVKFLFTSRSIDDSIPEPTTMCKTSHTVKTGVSIEQHTHTKRGFEMFVVILADRVERAEYLELLAQAKTLSGWYSRKWGSTPAGFAFKSQEVAEQFAASLGNETPIRPTPKPETAEKMRKLADNMQGAIDNKFADRQTNTPKRLQEAGRARHEGDRLQRTQTVLRKLADLHENGEIPALIASITSKKAVYDLMKSDITSGQSYYDTGIDSGKPYHDTPETLALWEFLTPKTAEQEKQEELKRLVDDLQFSNIAGYFPTPEKVVQQMLDLVNIQSGELVLEPEAGSGSICDLIKANHATAFLDAYETQHSLQKILELKGINVVGGDFLENDIENKYDVVVMNPPFEKQADIHHVLHAYNALKVGGRMAAVMSPSPFFNQNSLAESFRQWFAKYDGYKIDLPEGSFKASGTNVNTILIYLEKR